MEEIHTFTNTFAWKYICGFFNLNIYFSTFQAGCQELFAVFFITGLDFWRYRCYNLFYSVSAKSVDPIVVHAFLFLEKRGFYDFLLYRYRQ